MKPADGTTVIGKSVVIRGGISGNEDLFIDGEIEGTITLHESRLTIGPNARIHADIEVRDVVVLGRVEGNVHATGRVDLRQSAVVLGDIVAGRLAIEESAQFKGRVELKVDSSDSKTATTAASVGHAAVQDEGATSLFSQPGV